MKIEAINSGENASGYHFRVNASVEGNNTEKEPNDDISLAKSNNSISLNTLFTGNIQTYDDTDYYHFKISQPGIFNIKFSHDFIDTDIACWEITVLGGVIENGISARIPGNVTDFEMDTIRLSPAEGDTTTDYYLKIESGNEYISSDYNFIVNYSPEASWEIGKTGPYLYDKEPNNEPSSATQIELNTEISGNIQTDSDVDYYEINVPGDGMISLTFEHEFIDSDRVLWAVDLLGGAGGDDMEFPNIRSTGQQENLTSDNARIPAGVYYVRVKPSQYDNSEYKLKVNYAQ